jgi:DNA-binding CsgD family transcriptional regulator
LPPAADATTPATRAGRHAELAVLAGAVAEAEAGRATSVVVVGPAGVGKTWLLERFVATVGSDTRVLHLELHPAEADLPFAGLHHLLGPLADRIAALPEVPRRAIEGALDLAPVPPSHAFAVAGGLHRLLADLAEETLTVVVVDDVQWLDAPTHQALMFAIRRLDVDRVVVVLAARAPHRPDVRGAHGTVVELAPLDDAAARALLRARDPAPAVPAAEAIVAASGGLPLALVEIPAGLSEAELRSEVAFPDPTPARQALHGLYERRLADLDEATQLALVVAALEPLDRDRLAAALGRAGLDLDAYHDPERAGLVRVGPKGVSFTHPTAAAAVLQGATDAMRRRAHRLVAGVLVDVPARRARHLAAVSIGPDREVHLALVAAADEAERRGAWLTAGQVLEDAAERATTAAEREQARERATIGYIRAGAPGSALRLLDGLIASTATEHDRVARETERLAVRIWAGDRDLEVEAIRDLAARLAGEAPVEVARLLTTRAIGLVILGRGREARADAEAARRLLTEGVDDDLTLACDVVDLHLGGPGGTVLTGSWAERLTDADLASPSLVVMAATSSLIWADEPARAERLIERQLAVLRRIGALGQVGITEGLAALIAQRRGDWTTAEARHGAAVDLCTDTDMHGPLPHLLLRRAHLLVARGADERAEAQMEAATARAPSSAIVLHLDAWVRGVAALGHGRAHEAVAHLRRAESLERRIGIRQPGYSTAWADLVEALWRVGDLDEAARANGVLHHQAERAGRPSPAALAARGRALLVPDDDIDAAFGAARDQHGPDGDVFETARTELCWGRRLRRARRKRDARDHLRSALHVFERLGAQPWAGQARSELAACGERRRSGRSATAELTPRELEVAVAVARGASNPEAAVQLCISRRTVEDHLGRVYRKLGVRDRRDLAAVLGLGGPDPA